MTPWTIALQTPMPMVFPRQEYWMDCHFLLQGISLTQGSNPSLLHWQVDSLPLNHQESPQIFCLSQFGLLWNITITWGWGGHCLKWTGAHLLTVLEAGCPWAGCQQDLVLGRVLFGIADSQVLTVLMWLFLGVCAHVWKEEEFSFSLSQGH